MSNKSKLEYLNEIKTRYMNSSKLEKQKILDEFCKVCCYNRKYAIQLLNSKKEKTKNNLLNRGRKKEYNHPVILEVIRYLWTKTNLPCSKRLKAIISLWLPFCEHQFSMTEEIHAKILKISPATIDRLLKPSRHQYKKRGLATTKPGSILKKHIPIKTDQWNESIPGFIEADTVAHCGTSTEGMFVFTVNCVDIATSWTENPPAGGLG